LDLSSFGNKIDINNDGNISPAPSLILYNKITELINQNFSKLNLIHKKLLIKYLYKLVILFSFYYYTDNFIEQMFMNKYQDIFSLLVLLIPYYELNTSKNIVSLDELFLNYDSKAKSLSSGYYIDHLNFKLVPNYLENYFLSHTSDKENSISIIMILMI
jgi:hypothetical protein